MPGSRLRPLSDDGTTSLSSFHSQVIAAVNDFCMGLGIGLVASCDMIIASKQARFGLPEVDNGALGCASHLAKLVAPMKLREMSLTWAEEAYPEIPRAAGSSTAP